jgi:hypothetical protein
VEKLPGAGREVNLVRLGEHTVTKRKSLDGCSDAKSKSRITRMGNGVFEIRVHWRNSRINFFVSIRVIRG